MADDDLLEIAMAVLGGANQALQGKWKGEREDALMRKRIDYETESKIRVAEKTPRDVWNPETKTWDTRYGAAPTQLKGEPSKLDLEIKEANLEEKKAKAGFYKERGGDVIEQQEERAYKRKERRGTEKANIVAKFNAEPSVKKSQQSVDAVNYIRGLVNGENPIAFNAIPTYMARASGEVGNLSEPDKKPFGGDQSIMERLKQAFTQGAEGKMTEENRKFIRDLTDTMEKRADENIVNLAKKRAKQYSTASGFLNENDVLTILIPDNADKVGLQSIGGKTPTRAQIEQPSQSIGRREEVGNGASSLGKPQSVTSEFDDLWPE